MTQPFRTDAGGRVDRSRPLTFSFNGEELQGYAGDSLASALLANGVHTVASSIKLGRARGIAAAGPEDPSGVVQIAEPFPDPMQLATTTELFPGLVAFGLSGQGILADTADPARYDSVHLHVDVLVVGAGPAGLVAAATAARAGVRVALVDEQPEAGGSLLGTPQSVSGQPGAEWTRGIVEELRQHPGVTHLQRTTVFGLYDDGLALAVQRRTDHLGTDDLDTGHLGTAARRDALRQRVWRIRARQIIVAAGAHERPVVFADNDRPGILLAGSARTYLHR